MSFRRPSNLALPTLLGALTLCGCKESDLEAFDRAGSLAQADFDAVGKFETRIYDMLDGTSKLSHHVADYDLGTETEIILPEGVEMERDALIGVRGLYDGEGALLVDDFEIIERPPQPLLDPEIRGPRRIATVLLQWNGNGLPNDEGRIRMYTGEDSTNVFYAENSYGIETMSGDVFGPYEIDDPGGCNTAAIASAGRTELILHGHNPEKWRQFMYHFPSGAGCSFGGLAQVGSPDNPAANSWYNGQFGCVTRNQELGHNYGMGHSRRWDCTDDMGEDIPYSATCSDVEYGDRYDPMGGGCGHINIVQKEYMGWVDDCNVVTVTDSGTFNLMPIELPCDGIQGLRFADGDGMIWWLEYRRRLGHFDNTIAEGIIVHVAGETAAAPRPYLIDLGQGDLLFEGDSYAEPSGAVTFQAVEFNDTHAVVEVTFANPSGQAPTCLDGSNPGMDAGNIGPMTCAEVPYDGDMEPPEITITFPEHDAWFDPGSDFTIQADVSDDRMIIDVELYLDGEKLFRITEPPWEWDVTDIPEGDYNFGAVARDSRYFTPSNAIDVHIGENPNPETGGSTGGDDSGSTTDVPGTTTGTDEGSTGDDSGEGGQDGDDKGCGCRHRGGDGAPTFALLVLGLLGIRRRR